MIIDALHENPFAGGRYAAAMHFSTEPFTHPENQNPIDPSTKIYHSTRFRTLSNHEKGDLYQPCVHRYR